MKKILLPIFLLLASPVFAGQIPNEAKQQLGQRIGIAVMQKDVEKGATLAQALSDLQEKYLEEKDQNWIQSKFSRLQQIEGLEIPIEKDQLQFPLEKDEQKTDAYEKPSSGGFLSYLGFGSTKKEISQANLPVFGPENNPVLENEKCADLSQSTLFVVQEKNNLTNELQQLIAKQEQLEAKQNKLTTQLNKVSLSLNKTRYAIAIVLEKSNSAKDAIEEKRKEKENAMHNQAAEIKALEEKLAAAKNTNYQITQSFKVLNIENS